MGKIGRKSIEKSKILIYTSVTLKNFKKEIIMKKTFLALSLATIAATASAANYMSVDLDRVKDDKSGVVSHAQYVRAGVDAYGLNLGLQVRTATFSGGGMVNSLEGTAGKNFGPVNLFAGVGHDNGWNGGRHFQYGLLGGSIGMPLGPVYGFAGVKTRVNNSDANPSQTVTFAGVSNNLTKNVSVNVGWSKSFQDIRETALGVGVRVGF